MALVLIMAGAIWGIGALMKAPLRDRLIMIGVLIGAVIVAQLALPDGHPLREATGSEPEFWLLILAGGVLVWGYTFLLRKVRAKAQPQPAPETPRDGPFSPDELDRYARHIVLRELGGPGQKRLKEASVLVVGAGGLGAPALQYLAAAGVGTIGVIDGDTVEASNLQRQVIHGQSTIGMPKVFSAAERIADLNPHVTVRPYNRRLTGDIAEELIAEYDVVLDGCDNFDTRYLVNRACVATKTPLIAAALTQWEGQISLYDPATDGPCYECVFAERPAPGLVPTCAEAGVVSPLPGVIGSMMAVEALKALTGAGDTLRGRMLFYDALYADTRIVSLKKRPDCPVCGS